MKEMKELTEKEQYSLMYKFQFFTLLYSFFPWTLGSKVVIDILIKPQTTV